MRQIQIDYNLTRITTFIKPKLKKSDENIVKYKVAANITEIYIIRHLTAKGITSESLESIGQF